MSRQTNTIVITVSMLACASGCRDEQPTAGRAQDSSPRWHAPGEVPEQPETGSVDAEIEQHGATDKLTGSLDLETGAAMAVRENPARLYRRTLVPKSFHYSDVFRWEIRVVVPAGLSRKDLADQLRLAASDLARERHADAISVIAYLEDDDVGGVTTVAQATMAPNGKWADAHLNDDSTDLEFIIEWISDNYLAPPEQSTYPKEGDEVLLKPTFGDTVTLSRSRDDWSDKYIIARVPAGTVAQVVSRERIHLFEGEYLIRYKVSVIHENEPMTAWVGRFNVEERE